MDQLSAPSAVRNRNQIAAESAVIAALKKIARDAHAKKKFIAPKKCPVTLTRLFFLGLVVGPAAGVKRASAFATWGFDDPPFPMLRRVHSFTLPSDVAGLTLRDVAGLARTAPLFQTSGPAAWSAWRPVGAGRYA